MRTKPYVYSLLSRPAIMANTYSQLYIQIVFAVQERKHFIKEDFREDVQKYITGIIKGKDQKLYAIYCMPDHTHLIVSMKPSIAISDLVRDIKTGSSGLIKKQGWVRSKNRKKKVEK